MSFVWPAMASPLRPGFVIEPGLWRAEEKLDGHRLIVSVGDPDGRTLFDSTGVCAWSRDHNPRELPAGLRESLGTLPPGTYDGELLVPGARSYGVTVLENADQLVYVVFDVLHLLGVDLTAQGQEPVTYEDRRHLLERLSCSDAVITEDGPLRVAWSVPIACTDDVVDLAGQVWARDGEGLILKRRESLYRPGKRTKDWLKVKQLRSATLTVTGFQAGTMSENSIVVLRDDDGIETSVKWKNLEELAKIDADPSASVGRRLVIEYQERTPDGGYRHPRWDRWEDE